MEYMKRYIVDEDTLKRLLEDSIELAMLNADGVDNWTWYGEGRQELIKEYFPDASEEELEDLDFEDCAEKDLEGFEVLEE